jgi:hypothetical protein
MAVDAVTLPSGIFDLYHGSRLTMWPSFRKHGVQPRGQRSEFAAGGAFYMATVPEYAAAFPSLRHVRKTSQDGILLLHFRLDLGLISEKFQVKILPQNDEAGWRQVRPP